MAIVRIKGSAKISWAYELVEDKDGGNFYMKVYPKLSNFKEDRNPEQIKQAAKDVLDEIKRNAKRRKTGNTRIA